MPARTGFLSGDAYSLQGFVRDLNDSRASKLSVTFLACRAMQTAGPDARRANCREKTRMFDCKTIATTEYAPKRAHPCRAWHQNGAMVAPRPEATPQLAFNQQCKHLCALGGSSTAAARRRGPPPSDSPSASVRQHCFGPLREGAAIVLATVEHTASASLPPVAIRVSHMQLLGLLYLPRRTVQHHAASSLDFHRENFRDVSIDLSTSILYARVNLGFAVTSS
jgi:hypothetical protein